jgi:hypothetical protein
MDKKIKQLVVSIDHLEKALSSLPNDNASADMKYYIKRAISVGKALNVKKERRLERVETEKRFLTLKEAQVALNQIEKLEKLELEKLKQLSKSTEENKSSQNGSSEVMLG